MNELDGPTFFDLDPQTGQAHPTTYDSMRAALLRDIPSDASLPDDVRQVLLAAVDYFALAYEQANIGRTHLYSSLVDERPHELPRTIPVDRPFSVT